MVQRYSSPDSAQGSAERKMPQAEKQADFQPQKFSNRFTSGLVRI
jgi:hypothetical protein